MLVTVFMKVLDLTREASFAILLVLAARLILKKAPKIFSYALWSVVLVRLLCPVQLEAPVSVVPKMESISTHYTLTEIPVSPVDAGVAAYQAVGDALNGGLGIQHIHTTIPNSAGGTETVASLWWEVWVLFGQYLWLAGIAGMGVYALLSYCKIRRKLTTAAPLRGNVWLADEIPSPFVLGLLRPRIYLPSNLAQREQSYILLHEQHHIRRLDHIFKALGFLALTIHWFNPLVWVAFLLASKDMEMSCDEAVVKKLGEGIRADYTASLLSLATGKRIIAGTPLAFGEGDTGGRIRNLARWKKPTLWVVLAALLLCAGLGIALLTDPPVELPPIHSRHYNDIETVYRTPTASSIEQLSKSPSYTVDENMTLFAVREYGVEGGMDALGTLTEFDLNTRNFDELFFRSSGDGWENGLNASTLRKNNAHAWMLIYRESSLYYVLQQNNGDIYLAFGYHDSLEKNDPHSDDTNLKQVVRLSEVPESNWNIAVDFSKLQLNHTTYSEETFLVLEDGAELPYHLTYTSACVILEVGVMAEDGSKICETIQHGYGVGTLQNIPAGSYRVFVRNIGYVNDLPGESVEVGVLLAQFNDAQGNRIAVPAYGTTYVPYQCIYMNPLSSYWPHGGDSGCKYILGEDHFTKIYRLGDEPSAHSIAVDQWVWRPVTITEEEWNELYFFPETGTEANLYELVRSSFIQPLNKQYFLLRSNDFLWLVQVFPSPGGSSIHSIYSLVPESTMGMVQWEYVPNISAHLPFFSLDFYLPCTEVSLFCHDGQLVTYHDGVFDYHTSVTWKPGEPLYWTAAAEQNDFGTLVSDARITFTAQSSEDQSWAGTIYFTSKPGPSEVFPIYTAALVGTGLHLTADPEGDGAIISAVADSGQ